MQRRGPLISASDRPVGSSGCSSGSDKVTASIRAGGRGATSCVRRTTNRSASSSEKTPERQAATYSPMLCPTMACGTMPRSVHSWASAHLDGEESRLQMLDLIEPARVLVVGAVGHCPRASFSNRCLGRSRISASRDGWGRGCRECSGRGVAGGFPRSDRLRGERPERSGKVRGPCRRNDRRHPAATGPPDGGRESLGRSGSAKVSAPGSRGQRPGPRRPQTGDVPSRAARFAR